MILFRGKCNSNTPDISPVFCSHLAHGLRFSLRIDSPCEVKKKVVSVCNISASVDRQGIELTHVAVPSTIADSPTDVFGQGVETGRSYPAGRVGLFTCI